MMQVDPQIVALSRKIEPFYSEVFKKKRKMPGDCESKHSNKEFRETGWWILPGKTSSSTEQFLLIFTTEANAIDWKQLS